MSQFIYVAHPFAGRLANILKTRMVCRRIVNAGDVPVAPALYCSMYLREEVPEERKAGLAIAISLLEMCDEVWAFPAPATSFVHEEVKRACALGIPVVEKSDVVLDTEESTSGVVLAS